MDDGDINGKIRQARETSSGLSEHVVTCWLAQVSLHLLWKKMIDRSQFFVLLIISAHVNWFFIRDNLIDWNIIIIKTTLTLFLIILLIIEKLSLKLNLINNINDRWCRPLRTYIHVVSYIMTLRLTICSWIILGWWNWRISDSRNNLRFASRREDVGLVAQRSFYPWENCSLLLLVSR